jgi:predicted nucleic acid-binding Zn ribbon protein
VSADQDGEEVFHVEQERSGRSDGDAEQAVSAPTTGPDLVRAALAAARAAAAAKGVTPVGPRRKPPAPRRGRLPGAGRDVRDPMLFGDAVRRLVEERGWQETTTNAGVLQRWDELVGAELAEHCRPQSLVDGELVLVAESSAWATQVRLLAGQLLATLRQQVGPGVVTRVVVRGPAQPDWRKGPRRVQGRGPRDTYG